MPYFALYFVRLHSHLPVPCANLVNIHICTLFEGVCDSSAQLRVIGDGIGYIATVFCLSIDASSGATQGSGLVSLLCLPDTWPGIEFVCAGVRV